MNEAAAIIPRWLLCAADRRPGLSILLFHRVLAERDPFRPGDLTATEFDGIVGFLARSFVVLPLDEAVSNVVGTGEGRVQIAVDLTGTAATAGLGLAVISYIIPPRR